MGYLLVVLLLVVTAVFVAVEMAVFSVRSERLGQAEENGDRRGSIVLGFLADPPKFLSAFQISTTLSSILIGAYGQSYIANHLGRLLDAAGWQMPDVWAFWITVASTTFLTLVFSNLLPKQIGFVWAEEVSLLTARASSVYVRVTRPLSWILEIIARGLSTLFRIPISSASQTTEADVVFLLKQGRDAVQLDPSERRIAENAFKLSDIYLSEVMTERNRLVWIDESKDRDEIDRTIVESGRSFLPVCKGSLDNVIGIVKARDYLASARKSRIEIALRKSTSPPLIVQSDTRLLKLIERLQETEHRVAIVVGNDQRVIGMVTLNDVVTAVVGPIRSV